MKCTAGLTLILTISCSLLSTFPVSAGEWQQHDHDKWQYIQDDGTKATGRLEIDDEYYYFDENGDRREDYWLKDDGSWYYFGEDGAMVTESWVDNYYVNEDGQMEKKR